MTEAGRFSYVGRESGISPFDCLNCFCGKQLDYGLVNLILGILVFLTRLGKLAMGGLDLGQHSIGPVDVQGVRGGIPGTGAQNPLGIGQIALVNAGSGGFQTCLVHGPLPTALRGI